MSSIAAPSIAAAARSTIPSLIAAALAIAAFGFHGAAGHAATITLDTKMTAGATPLQPVTVTFRLRLAGPIEDGDAEKLREILSKLSIPSGAKSDGSLTKIELSSLGGNLLEGFEIGSLLRKYKVIAVVRKQDICLSACALALLAGNAHSVPSVYPTECNVEIGAKVGFHNFSLNRNGLRDATSQDPVASRLQGFADARGGAAQLVKYAGEIGLPPSFVSSLIGRPVEDFLFIETAGQFISLRVCPIGINRPAIALAAQAINICSNSTGGPDPSAPLEATAIKPAQAKLYLLERVQENMKSSKAKGRLADQLSSGAVMRVKEEIDRLYDDLRAAGVALPDIVGPTFDIGRRRDGGYETVCYVSLSSDNPDNYDVVTQGPRGLSDPLRPPPENSRRLFLFNRDDVVNPRRR